VKLLITAEFLAVVFRMREKSPYSTMIRFYVSGFFTPGIILSRILLNTV
jgi:hypothetical protein